MNETRRFVKAKDNETTDNGIRFITFAASKNMVISSTFFRRKEIHKATWVHTDGVTMHQIDHIAIDKRHASSILDVRTMRGAEVGSDHFLVRAKFRAKISHRSLRTPNTSKRHHIEALKQPEMAPQYQQKVEEALLQIDTTSISAEEHWNQVSEAINNTATQVLGERPTQEQETLV